MPDNLVITLEAPDTRDAIQLMDELSAALEAITGNSGRGSFNPGDVCVPRALFAVARNKDGEAVGCGAIRPMDTGIAEVKRMYARTKGAGIGTQILSCLEEKARDLGYTALRLETRKVNREAVAFYESRGYYRIPNYGKYIDNDEAVCFEKKLIAE